MYTNIYIHIYTYVYIYICMMHVFCPFKSQHDTNRSHPITVWGGYDW